MTCIACNLSTMAADTLWAGADGGHYFASKVFQLEDGSLIGGAGGGHETVMEWIIRGSNQHDLPPLPADDASYHILRLQKDGIYIYNSVLTPWKLKDRNYAVGLGADVALYCMRVLKKTPAVAVREAAKINRCCGGTVEVLRVGVKK